MLEFDVERVAGRAAERVKRRGGERVERGVIRALALALALALDGVDTRHLTCAADVLREALDELEEANP